jgi:hypothetical protein
MIIITNKFHKFIIIGFTAVFLGACSGDYEASGEVEAEDAMKFEFEKYQKNIVTNIRVKQISRADSFRAWYKFSCSEDEFREIIGTGFKKSSYEIYTEFSFGSNKPKFWDLNNNSSAIFLEKRGWKTEFSSSLAVAAYDRERMTAYFCHDAEL